MFEVCFASIVTRVECTQGPQQSGRSPERTDLLGAALAVGGPDVALGSMDSRARTVAVRRRRRQAEAASQQTGPARLRGKASPAVALLIGGLTAIGIEAAAQRICQSLASTRAHGQAADDRTGMATPCYLDGAGHGPWQRACP